MACYVVVIASTMLVPVTYLAPSSETHYKDTCANKRSKPGGCAGSLSSRTNVPDIRVQNPHYYTDFLRDIRPVFSSHESRHDMRLFPSEMWRGDPYPFTGWEEMPLLHTVCYHLSGRVNLTQ